MSDDTELRPRRSVLYMPAANERALEKAKTIPADALIFDLEDAVAPEAKETARGQAVAAASSGQYGSREVTIRCNGLDTTWGADDLAAAATSGAAAVVIPKVDSVADLDAISSALDQAGAPAELSIWAMIETPTAIFDARSLAAHPRVSVLVMGTNDLAKELRADPGADRGPLLPHLSTALLAAREAGIVILDGVYNDVKDLDGFRAECSQGATFGFDGKTLIHPGQVEIANDVWAPDAAEIEYAERVIAAFAEAEADGRGVVTVDGATAPAVGPGDGVDVEGFTSTVGPGLGDVGTGAVDGGEVAIAHGSRGGV
jgi:citrate lyase subunit beta/citryl-CoA lyase